MIALLALHSYNSAFQFLKHFLPVPGGLSPLYPQKCVVKHTVAVDEIHMIAGYKFTRWGTSNVWCLLVVQTPWTQQCVISPVCQKFPTHHRNHLEITMRNRLAIKNGVLKKCKGYIPTSGGSTWKIQIPKSSPKFDGDYSWFGRAKGWSCLSGLIVHICIYIPIIPLLWLVQSFFAPLKSSVTICVYIYIYIYIYTYIYIYICF